MRASVVWTSRQSSESSAMTDAENNDNVDEVVLGNGAARLDVGVVMGWATIRADLR